MDKPIILKRDIISQYAKKRKALCEADVRDLLRCTINYMHDDMDTAGRAYAFKVPHIGFMYRKLPDIPYEEANSHPYLIIDMMKEVVFSDKRVPLVMSSNNIKRTNWPYTLEEIETIQNELAEKSK